MDNQTMPSSIGRLRIDVTSTIGAIPIKDAKISISYAGDPESVIEEVNTDENGQTGEVELDAPPIELSLQPENQLQPYSEYNLTIEAPNYFPVNISGTEILSDTIAIQPVRMRPLESNNQGNYPIVIGPHTLYGDYPPKIAEAEIKPLDQTGEIVLSRVVVPEYVIVHDGAPSDTSATDYYVKYKDYIKNVASCEVYATWPESTLQANILAIMSFTLNRVYTEWYRNKGYNFTITSSTAFDHKWIPGKNVYDNISRIVDVLFTNYLSRPNVSQPILTQYCDGQRVQCPNWMTQWGSKYLGDQNYSAIEILRHFYGNDIYINTADEISGIPSSWPGSDLTIGSRGPKVRQMQEQLNRIRRAYPALPAVTADGVFGTQTENAVKKFQQIFGLPATGIVDYPTWYKISEIFVGVSRIAELQ